jgi:osmotically-inducible protein OsmY
MGLLSRFLGGKYDDEQILSHAKTAIAEDPLVNDAASVTIASAKGVVKLTGTVHRLQEKDRIEGVIRNALRTLGLKHERILNELKVSQPDTGR